MWIELLLAALGIGLAGVAIVLTVKLHARLRALDERIIEGAGRGSQLRDRVDALDRAEERQRRAEAAVDTGATVVREVHRGIADIPFSILEAIPVTRQPTKVVREIHDRIADGVYDAISGINKAVGRELRRGLRAEEQAATGDAAAERVTIEEPRPTAIPGPSSEPGKP